MKGKNGGMKNLLSSGLLLNIVAVISFLTFIGYILVGEIRPLILFILLAGLLYRFTYNMIIILGVPTAVAGIYYALKFSPAFREGMENTDKTTTTTTNASTKNKPSKQDIKDEVRKTIKSGNGTLDMTKLDVSGNNDESFEVGRSRKGQYNIDYASTVEDAYDELNNILGSDGIKRLTDDTQKLMNQQLKLAEAMKSMTPIVQNIAPMVENLKGMMGSMNNAKEGTGGLMEMLSSMSKTSKPKSG